MSGGSLKSIEEELERLNNRQKLALIEQLARSMRHTTTPGAAEERRVALIRLREASAACMSAIPLMGGLRASTFGRFTE